VRSAVAADSERILSARPAQATLFMMHNGMLVGSVDALWRVVDKCCLGLFDFNKSTKKMVRNRSLYTMYGIGLEHFGVVLAIDQILFTELMWDE
jgi:hypothetical protein